MTTTDNILKEMDIMNKSSSRDFKRQQKVTEEYRNIMNEIDRRQRKGES